LTLTGSHAKMRRGFGRLEGGVGVGASDVVHSTTHVNPSRLAVHGTSRELRSGSSRMHGGAGGNCRSAGRPTRLFPSARRTEEGRCVSATKNGWARPRARFHSRKAKTRIGDHWGPCLTAPRSSLHDRQGDHALSARRQGLFIRHVPARRTTEILETSSRATPGRERRALAQRSKNRRERWAAMSAGRGNARVPWPNSSPRCRFRIEPGLFGTPMEPYSASAVLALRLAGERGGGSTTTHGADRVYYHGRSSSNVGLPTPTAHEQAKWFGDDSGLKAEQVQSRVPSRRASSSGSAGSVRSAPVTPPLHVSRLGIESVSFGSSERRTNDRGAAQRFAKGVRAEQARGSSKGVFFSAMPSVPRTSFVGRRGWPGHSPEGGKISHAARKIASLSEYVDGFRAPCRRP